MVLLGRGSHQGRLVSPLKHVTPPEFRFYTDKTIQHAIRKDRYMTLHDVVGVDKNEKFNRKNVVGCREHSQEKRRTRIDFLCNDMQTAEPSTSWAEGGGAFPQILAGI